MKNNYFSKSFDLEDLYIRSYLIKTENWDENDLKKVFKNGCLYLSLMNALAHPVLASKKIFRKLNILLKK
jgi:magnesium-protoporphyrin IX monomethyl ester (oxidative) cyclase